MRRIYLGEGRWCRDDPIPQKKIFVDENRGRKPPGFVFGCDSPDKKQDPGPDYMSNEERRVYNK